MKKRFGFHISWRGISWLTMRDDGETLVISQHRIPPYPRQYGGVISVEPDALEPKAIFDAVYGCIRQAQGVSARLPFGLNWRTLRLYYVNAEPFAKPGEYEANTLLGWKADGR